MTELICPVCKSNEVKVQEKRLELYYCNSCTHCFTNLDEDPSLYHNLYFSQERENWFKYPDVPLYEHVYRRIISLVPPPMKLIDVGCGNGAFLKFLKKKEKPIELYGIDLVENSYPGINFIRGDFNSFDIKEKFDVVTSFMAIEHLREVDSFIKKITRISNERSSWLIINTINNNSLIYLFARLLNKFGFRTAHDRLYSRHHLNHFTNKSLKILVEKNGFKVIEHWNHNYPMIKVDVPKSSVLFEKLYRFGIFLMFRISDVIGNGHSQTIIANKEWRK